jgi:hypothetical protein
VPALADYPCMRLPEQPPVQTRDDLSSWRRRARWAENGLCRSGPGAESTGCRSHVRERSRRHGRSRMLCLRPHRLSPQTESPSHEARNALLHVGTIETALLSEPERSVCRADLRSVAPANPPAPAVETRRHTERRRSLRAFRVRCPPAQSLAAPVRPPASANSRLCLRSPAN